MFEFPSQIQLLVEKLPGWFKAKWSDKIIKLQREKGKDAFHSFNDFAETVKYHAERMNIPQILSSATIIEQLLWYKLETLLLEKKVECVEFTSPCALPPPLPHHTMLVQQHMIFTSILQHFPMRDTTGNQHCKVGEGGGKW